jgi:hypothetical protein
MKTTLTILTILAAATITGYAGTKDLKVIDGKEIETRPAKELNAMVAAAPTERVHVVTAIVFLNENVTDYYKWLYDSEKRVLALMQRTTMKAVGEEYMWRVWHDVSPEDFSERLPYGNEKIKTTASPYGKAVQTFPLSYPSNPEITKWP